MRILLAIAITLAAAWAGYWFIGSAALQSGIAAWFEAREADGWVADYEDLSVRGFPNRFDTTFTAPVLSDPAAGLGWQAPFFQLMTLSYRPNHIIAVWPHEQRIETPAGALALGSRDLRASLVVEPNTALELRRSTLTANAITATPDDGGGTLSAGRLRLAAERMGDAALPGGARYHLGLAAEDVAPPAALMQQLDPGDTLPRVAGSVLADVTVDFDAPWDRRALEEVRPQPTRIAVTSANVTWGEMSVDATGALQVDIGGRPTGRLSVTVRDWRQMLRAAVAAEWLTPDLGETTARAMDMLSGDGDGKSLTVSLNFRGGRIWVGPLPIAPAPVLRLH